ncbi:hypothetical protein RRG08_033215 [Elysia crispata]|uniref:Uncharacterized protein n=1 Tax=Elysia crispata TaxID=231223 RepID=A0AAE1BBP9_9GAST|nr:hypothetical protein RRG08_033215 [Elysia crispata]
MADISSKHRCDCRKVCKSDRIERYSSKRTLSRPDQSQTGLAWSMFVYDFFVSDPFPHPTKERMCLLLVLDKPAFLETFVSTVP